MIGHAIVNPRFQNSATYNFLAFNQVRFSDAIIADIIMNDVSPSLAIRFIDVREIESTETHQALQELSNQLKNSYIIAVGELSNRRAWMRFQMSFGMTGTRFLHVPDEMTAANLTMEIYDGMTQKDKHSKQVAYFQKIENECCSQGKAHEILHPVLKNIAADDKKLSILANRLPTIADTIIYHNELDLIPGVSKAMKENAKTLFGENFH